MITESDLTLPDGASLHVYDTGPSPSSPVDELAVLWHHGTPNIGAPPAPLFAESQRLGIRWIAYDRPGYGGSTPRPGRDVGSAAILAAATADALGVGRFATMGHSGGGPHALACAALLPDRVVAAASLAGVGPFDAADLDFLAGMGEGNVEEFGTAVADGEPGVRAFTEQLAAALLAASREQFVEEMAPFLTDVDAAELRGPLGEVLVAALHSGLASGVDGWVDDDLMFVRPWGFAVEDIRVPTLVWQGRQDVMVPFAHGEWLAAHVPGTHVRLTDDDGHLTLQTRRIPDVHGWLRAQWDAAGGARPAP